MTDQSILWQAEAQVAECMRNDSFFNAGRSEGIIAEGKAMVLLQYRSQKSQLTEIFESQEN